MTRLPPEVRAIIDVLADHEPRYGFQRASEINVTADQVLAIAEADFAEVVEKIDVLALLQCATRRDRAAAEVQLQGLVTQAVQSYLLPELTDECERRAGAEREELAAHQYRRGTLESRESYFGVPGAFDRSHLQ